SKFGENYKYGVFPSGSFAWRVSNEAFWPQNEILTNLKGRFSYGVIGNSEIGTFQSIPTIQVVGEGTFNNDEPYNGLAPDKYADPNLRWERANQADVGLDMEFLAGKVSTTVDYYYRLTSDLLLNNQLPSTTGFETSLTNVGSVINRGLEWTVNSVNVDKEFFWSTNFNISFNRNEVDKLATDNDIFLGGALYLPTGWSILREGESLGTFFGYKSDGLFQSDAEIAEGPLLSSQSLSGSAKPGDRRYKDLGSRNTSGQLESDADGIINEADRTVIGNANPDFTWAITNTFKYKGFDLSIFIQGSQGNDVINANLFEIGNLNAETNVLTEYYTNAWTSENPNNNYPRINQDRNAETVFSDAFVEDGSFARLQNVTLGYTFPSRIMTPVGISKLRIYVSGNNLVTLTQYSGFDPEVNAFGNSSLFQLYQGIDYGGYPTTRSYIAGLQLTF
ncbi:MAG: SusC/RagA family TonB-linked outer membrane protein, partial [Cyclobacteriaceae bacterium]